MKRERGFSLLEVLVTLLIVSLGLLGVSALIANSLKYNQSSYARTEANWLANQIIDQMRANRGAALLATTATPPVYSSPYTLAAGSTTAASGAPADLAAWLGDVARLPGGKAGIACNSGTGMFTITVEWDDASRMSSATGATGGTAVSNSGTLVVETKL